MLQKLIKDGLIKLETYFSRSPALAKLEFGPFAVFKKKVPYYYPENFIKPNKFFFVATRQFLGRSLVLGFIEVELAPDKSKTMWFCNISTREEFRNKGISTELIQYSTPIIKLLMKNHKRDLLTLSSYTFEGRHYIKPRLEAALSHSNINFQ